jgi:hypothetical protein
MAGNCFVNLALLVAFSFLSAIFLASLKGFFSAIGSALFPSTHAAKGKECFSRLAYALSLSLLCVKFSLRRPKEAMKSFSVYGSKHGAEAQFSSLAP